MKRTTIIAEDELFLEAKYLAARLSGYRWLIVHRGEWRGQRASIQRTRQASDEIVLSRMKCRISARSAP